MQARAWLIAYDICDPRRLVRVHRRMLRYATPIEYSVFWMYGTPARRVECLADVGVLLKKGEDDLRVYAIPGRGLRLRLGAPVLPQGIQWSALPAAFLWDGLAHEAVGAASARGWADR